MGRTADEVFPSRRGAKCGPRSLLFSVCIIAVLVLFSVFRLVVHYQSTKGMDSPRGAGVPRDGVSHTSSGNDLIGSPYVGTSLFGEQDDMSIGKSCLYNSHKKRWVCRDCRYTHATNVSEQTQQHTQQRCQVLKRRGKCPPFRTQGWDTPEPRSFSSYDPQSTTRWSAVGFMRQWSKTRTIPPQLLCEYGSSAYGMP